MPPRALMKSMSTHTMVFMAGSTPPCITPAPSHPVAVAPRRIDQIDDAQQPGKLGRNLYASNWIKFGGEYRRQKKLEIACLLFALGIKAWYFGEANSTGLRSVGGYGICDSFKDGLPHTPIPTPLPHAQSQDHTPIPSNFH